MFTVDPTPCPGDIAIELMSPWLDAHEGLDLGQLQLMESAVERDATMTQSLHRAVESHGGPVERLRVAFLKGALGAPDRAYVVSGNASVRASLSLGVRSVPVGSCVVFRVNSYEACVALLVRFNTRGTENRVALGNSFAHLQGHGVSQADIAAACGRSKQQVSDMLVYSRVARFASEWDDGVSANPDRISKLARTAVKGLDRLVSRNPGLAGTAISIAVGPLASCVRLCPDSALDADVRWSPEDVLQAKEVDVLLDELDRGDSASACRGLLAWTRPKRGAPVRSAATPAPTNTPGGATKAKQPRRTKRAVPLDGRSAHLRVVAGRVSDALEGILDVVQIDTLGDLFEVMDAAADAPGLLTGTLLENLGEHAADHVMVALAEAVCAFSRTDSGEVG